MGTIEGLCVGTFECLYIDMVESVKDGYLMSILRVIYYDTVQGPGGEVLSTTLRVTDRSKICGDEVAGPILSD